MMSHAKKWIVGLVAAPTVAVGAVVLTDAEINSYTDKGDRLAVVKQSTIEDAGENAIELVKARPEIRLKKWNGEVDLGVRYANVNASGSRVLLTNRMEWKEQKEEVHAYPLTAGDGMEDGGFEIEVVLNEKPTTNRFDFVIDGADQLDFFYQPPLTPEEIAEGVQRPENVVGSYAVYHKTKANHRVGSTNYATGKIAHIYRPKAIDAHGNETWAELNYDNGVLSVTVPQSFLDGAVYPVKVDPTIGYTTQGASGSSSYAAFFNPNRYYDRFGYPDTATENGTITQISAYLKASASIAVDTFVGVNQKDSGGSGVHAQIASGETLDLSLTTTVTLYNFAASGSITSGTTYIMNIVGNALDIASTANFAQVAYDTSAGFVAYDELFTNTGYAASKEDPWTIASSVISKKYSIYATYTATAAEIPVSSNSWWQFFE